MEPGATELALQVSPQPFSISRSTTLAEVVQADWRSACSLLGEDVKKFFDSHACSDLGDYLEKLEAVCQQHRDESFGFKVADWFQPIFKAVDLFMPVAHTAIQAYPNPGSLVLGGIVAVLQITSRLLKYHRLTLQMLARMGRKARILLEYEQNVYEGDYPVQKSLIQVYGDIAAFCQKAVRFLTENGQVRAKVKGLKLIFFTDYEYQLGQEVQNFEQHMEDLESRASLCDKKRLKELRDSQVAHQNEFGKMATEIRGHFQQHDDNHEILVNLWKVEQDIREQTERRKREKEKRRSLDWLSSVSFREAYDQRCKEHLGGTGSWFTESDTYKTWKSSGGSDLLWVNGKPGCGKSVLAAVTVHDLTMEIGPSDDVALAYAFCRREDESSQNPSTIFAGLVRQITEQQPSTNPVLELEFSKAQKGEKPSPSIVQMVLNSALPRFRKTFLLIDALDECKDNKQLVLDLLEIIQDQVASTVKIIIFSRHEWHLKDLFQNYKTMRPDDGANKDDLQAYIEWLFPDDVQANVNQEIRKECIAKADGMFLWVKLLEKSLQKPLLSKQKLRRIREIPPGLDSIYDRILNDIWEQDEDVRSIAFLVLMWVTHAQRPLSQSEMLEAVADYDEVATLEELKEHKHENPELLVAICANLVFIDKDGYFRLCHETVRTYLEDAKSNTNPPLAEYQQQKRSAHKHLAEICLKYLMLEDFECGPAKSPGRLKSLVKKSPFLAYAAEFWGSHVTEDNAPFLGDLISDFVGSTARRELSIQIYLYDPTEDSDLWQCPGSSNPLHVLSIFGLRQASEVLPDNASLSQEADGSGATPLTYALLGKHREMSLWLVELARNSGGLALNTTQKITAIHLAAGLGWADLLKKLVSEDESYVNSRPDGQTPLIRACKAGHKEAAETLISAGAKVDLKDGDGNSPLIVATVSGHKSLVALLLENRADPNCHDGDGTTPLHFAALYDHVDIARALLEKRADPVAMAPSADGQTPFHVAAENGSAEVIRALHQIHPKLDMKTTITGCTALHLAAWHNSSKCAQVLLELGASKDDADNEKQTALFIAAQEGHFDTVKVLIDAKCDVNLADCNGKTAVHAAARSGKLSVMRYVMRSQPIENWKALINTCSKQNETVLHAAIDGGNTGVVQFLLRAGADGTANGVLESSPLHYAAHYGHKTMSRPLLEHTKEANPRNQYDETPLHFAARARKLDFIIQFFLDCSELGLSIEINAQSKFKKTAFVAALGKGGKEVAEYLLKKSPISIRDDDGNYPIHLAAWDGFDSIVEALLTQDGTTSPGYRGRTPLCCAALRGQLTTLKILAEPSKEVLNLPDDTRTTPVSAALKGGHLDVANFLLDMGADHTVVDETGDNLLHIAALRGDLPMVKRLLKLGCKGDANNRYNHTPFHRAVEADSIEVLDALIEGGFNALDARNSTGELCGIIAAEQGNLEMLKKVTIPGAQYNSSNLMGRTTAFAAAYRGHWEILDFLKKHGETLETVDLMGNTTLIAAARGGNPDTVKYLLRTQAHTVNESNIWGRETALLVAAKRTSPLTVNHLLAAGADPYHRDASGLNALDYAARHRPTLREMHKAGYFHDQDSLKVQGQILRKTIRQSCEKVLQLPRHLSVADLFCRIDVVLNLAKALVCMQDYDAAKACITELFWHSESDDLRADYGCEMCGAQYFEGDKYVCKSCHRFTVLCKRCYDEYNSCQRGAPEALREIEELEKYVQPLRIAIPESMSLLNVFHTTRYFVRGSLWISFVSDEYEAWEQKYNSTDAYREFQRPGQQLVKMINEMEELCSKILQDTETDPEDVKNMAKLSHKYQVHRKKFRSDREFVDFICKDHEFFIVSDDERKTMKSAGEDLDLDSGKMTVSFLRRLLDKYNDSLDRQPNSKNPITDEWQAKLSRMASVISREDTSNRNTEIVDTVNDDAPRPRSLKRSTTSIWKPARRSTHQYPFSATKTSENTPNPFPFPENKKPTKPRRVQTLPVSVAQKQSLQIESLNVEMKDTRSLAVVNARAESIDETKSHKLPKSNQTQPTVKKTVSISVVNAPDHAAEQQVAVSTLAEGNNNDPERPVGSLETPMLALTLSSEPESVVDSSAEEPAGAADIAAITIDSSGTTATPAAANAANPQVASDDESGDLNPEIRILYMMFHDTSPADDNDVALWMLALSITDVMSPGFIENYVRMKKEEREAEDEQSESGNEEAAKSGSHHEDED